MWFSKGFLIIFGVSDKKNEAREWGSCDFLKLFGRLRRPERERVGEGVMWFFKGFLVSFPLEAIFLVHGGGSCDFSKVFCYFFRRRREIFGTSKWGSCDFSKGFWYLFRRRRFFWGHGGGHVIFPPKAGKFCTFKWRGSCIFWRVFSPKRVPKSFKSKKLDDPPFVSWDRARRGGHRGWYPLIQDSEFACSSRHFGWSQLSRQWSVDNKQHHISKY